MEAYEERSSRQQFLELCTEQMRARAMRPVVAEELEAHIEDQLEANLAAGMDTDQAEEEAIRQMGDPVDVGLALDRVHQPRMDWKAFGLMLALAATGILVQFLMQRENPTELQLYTYDRFMTWTVAGVGILIAFCLGSFDYTSVGKYPRSVWCVTTGLVLLEYMRSDVINGTRRGSWAVMLLVPAFAGLVFYYRKEKTGGIVKVLGWFAGTCLILVCAGCLQDGLLVKLWLWGCVLMLAFAVWRGWYGVPRRAGLLIGALPAAGALAFGVTAWLQGGYQAERIKAFLNPGYDSLGSGYRIGLVRQAVESLRLVGSSGAMMQEQAAVFREQGEDMALLWISQHYGLAAGLGILVLLLALTALLFYRVGRQRNRLGAILGLGCLYVFAVPVLLHTLMNLGLWMPINCGLPFISMNGSMSGRLYIIMGILLSIYRGSNILPEPKTAAGRAAGRERKVE